MDPISPIEYNNHLDVALKGFETADSSTIRSALEAIRSCSASPFATSISFSPVLDPNPLIQKLFETVHISQEFTSEWVQNQGYENTQALIEERLDNCLWSHLGAKVSENDWGKATLYAARSGNLNFIQRAKVVPIGCRAITIAGSELKQHLDIDQELRRNVNISEDELAKAVMEAVTMRRLDLIQKLFESGAAIPGWSRVLAIARAKIEGYGEVAKWLHQGFTISEDDLCQAVIKAAINGHLDLIWNVLLRLQTIPRWYVAYSIAREELKQHLDVSQLLRKEGTALDDPLAYVVKAAAVMGDLSLIRSEETIPGCCRVLAIAAAELEGYWEVLQELNQAALLSEDDFGKAFLIVAMSASLNFVRKLLEIGNPIPGKYRAYAIAEAELKGRWELIQELKKGEPISEEDRGKALIIATIKRRIDLIRQLGNRTKIIPGWCRVLAIAEAELKAYNREAQELKFGGRISKDDLGEAVIDAAARGRLDLIRQLLKNREIIPGLSKICRAIAIAEAEVKGYQAVAEELKKEGKISEVDLGNAVIYAAMNGRLDLIQNFLENEKEIPGKHRAVAIAAAQVEKYEDVVQALNSKVIISEDDLGNALIYGAILGDLDLVRKLLETVDVTRGKYRAVAIAEAKLEGYEEVAQELRKAGVISEEDLGKSVINAATKGRLDLICKLLENGKAIPGKYRAYAIAEAEIKGYEDVAQELKRVAISEEDLGQAVISGAIGGRLDLICKLLEKGRGIPGEHRALAIAWAELKRHGNVAQELRRVEIPEIDLGKAVISAAFNGRLDLIRKLLGRGKTIPGWCRALAIAKAKLQGHQEVVRELQEVEISRSDLGKAVIDAAGSGSLHTIQKLLENGKVISGVSRALAIGEARLKEHTEVALELSSGVMEILEDDWIKAIKSAKKSGRMDLARKLEEEKTWRSSLSARIWRGSI